MKYLGIDFGAKRIGLAVSDDRGAIAFPRETIANMPGALSAIREMVEEERIERVVVGDTRSYGGIPNPITSRAEDFAAKLGKQLGIPVMLASEAGSSMEANRFDPTHVHDDASAAAIILQRFLDMHGKA